MTRFVCDVCHRVIKPKDGMLHERERSSTLYGDMKGFVFYRWQETAARGEDIGHIHKWCVWEQVKHYLKTLGWGRIEVPGRRAVIVTRARVARRDRALRKATAA